MSKTFNYNTTKIKNPSTGEWENMNSITIKGKTAYEYAVEGGYEGSETEFAQKLSREYVVQSDFETLQNEVDELNINYGYLSAVSNLDDIPINFSGSVGLTADISPIGKVHTFTINGYGNSDSRRTIIVTNNATSETYIKCKSSGTWGAWERFVKESEFDQNTLGCSSSSFSSNQSRYAKSGNVAVAFVSLKTSEIIGANTEITLTGHPAPIATQDVANVFRSSGVVINVSVQNDALKFTVMNDVAANSWIRFSVAYICE